MIVPPSAIALSTKDVGKCRELQKRTIWPSEEYVLAFDMIRVVGNLDLHVELKKTATNLLESCVRLPGYEMFAR